mmetsp:Transcript_9370/g.10366  ORF Transcript_9370/g.10366 Transcript_9370/m.10366 type:complete len:175 (-) Transcript_9370:197-721(-)
MEKRRSKAGLAPSKPLQQSSMSKLKNKSSKSRSTRKMQSMENTQRNNPARGLSRVNRTSGSRAPRKMQAINNVDASTPSFNNSVNFQPINVIQNTHVTHHTHQASATLPLSSASPFLMSNAEEIQQELRSLSSLLSAGFITEGEFKKRRKGLLYASRLTEEHMYMVFQPRWAWI